MSSFIASEQRGSCTVLGTMWEGEWPSGAVVSAGYRPLADHWFAPEGKPGDGDGYCLSGPAGTKGLAVLREARRLTLSPRADSLPRDPDVGALNLALLLGYRDIEIAGFRPPREGEDTLIAEAIGEIWPSAEVTETDDLWKSFDRAPGAIDEPDAEIEFPGTELGKAAIVCCYRSGGPYDGHAAEYVGRLFAGVDRHSTLPHRNVVITDSPGEFCDLKGIEVLTMATRLVRWHSKFEIFRTELWEDCDTVLYLDIDTAVVSCIDTVLSANVEFALLSDILHPERPATGIILYRPDPRYRRLFERVCEFAPDYRTWDVYPLMEGLKELGVRPERLQDRFGIYSWKMDLHDWKAKSKDERPLPADAQFVCWHGRPRPHEVDWHLPAREQAEEPGWLEVPELAPTVAILGGGPSLKDFDVDSLLGPDDCVIGVNDAYRFECADYCLFSDSAWFRVHEDELSRSGAEAWTTMRVSRPWLSNVRRLRAWISTDPSEVAWNGNTGYCALNFALLGGARRIVMIGFDMDFRAGEPNWHPNIRRLKPKTFDYMLDRASMLASHIDDAFPGAEIVVCEPTRLEAWPTMPVADAVAWGRNRAPRRSSSRRELNLRGEPVCPSCGKTASSAYAAFRDLMCWNCGRQLPDPEDT